MVEIAIPKDLEYEETAHDGALPDGVKVVHAWEGTVAAMAEERRVKSAMESFIFVVVFFMLR